MICGLSCGTFGQVANQHSLFFFFFLVSFILEKNHTTTRFYRRPIVLSYVQEKKKRSFSSFDLIIFDVWFFISLVRHWLFEKKFFFIHLWLCWTVLIVCPSSEVLVCSPDESDIGSSPLDNILPGDGLSTGLKEKLGESALDRDSGVPTELNDPGNGLEIPSNLL